MIYFHVTYKVKPGQREAFYNAIKEAGFVEEIRKNPGNVKYDYYYDAANPDILFLVEGWKDKDSIKFHSEQPYRQVQADLKEQYATDVELKRIKEAE